MVQKGAPMVASSNQKDFDMIPGEVHVPT